MKGKTLVACFKEKTKKESVRGIEKERERKGLREREGRYIRARD